MRPSVRSLLGLPLAALLAVACGSSSTPAPSTAAPASQPPAAATATPAPPTPTPVPPTPTAQAPNFMGIVQGARTAMFKVSYNLKMVNAGQPPFNGTATMYVKPPKMRMDTVVPMDGQNLPGSIYNLEDALYMCSEMAGSKMCLKQAKTAAINDPSVDTFRGLQERPDDYVTESKGTRQIAGTTAYCFSIKKKANPGTAENETCYSSDSIPLLIAMKDGGMETEMLAQSFSKTVTDDDFKPPAQVMEFPGSPMGAGGMPGAGASGMPQGMPQMPAGMPTLPAGIQLPPGVTIPGMPTATP